MKLNANGSKAWDEAYGGAGSERLRAMAITSDGGYLLGGDSGSGISDDKSEKKTGYWILKLDATGKKVWDKVYSAGSFGLMPTLDGGYFLGGYSLSGYRVIKIKGNGDKVWDKIYGYYNKNIRGIGIITTPDGGFLLGGTSTKGREIEKNGYWVVKIKEDGTKVWEETFGSVEGGFNSFNLNALVATTDNAFVLGGSSYFGIGGDKSESSRGNLDYWVIKVADTNKKVQTITFSTPLTTKTLGDAPILLSAQASSGLPVTFSVVSGPGTLSNNTLTLTGVGRITVKASQAGDATYAAATDVLQAIIVDKPSTITKLWDKTFGGELNDALAVLAVAPDGGYLLGGGTNSGKGGDKSDANGGYWLVKVSKEGKKEWDRTLNVVGDLGAILSSILVTPDGGYLLGGSSIYDITTSYWIVKISKDGIKEWDKSFSYQSINYLEAMVNTADGGYLVGGHSDSDINRDKSEASRGGEDYWIIKIDNQGNKLWDKTLGGNGHDELTAILPTSDGGYLLGGWSVSDKSGEKSEAKKDANNINRAGDYWVVKIDAAGKKLWDKTLGGSNYDVLTALMVTPDGGYLLGGSSGSGKSGDKSEVNRGTMGEYGYPTSDYWLVKIDSKGKKVWDKTLGGKGYDELKKIATTPDGRFLLAGSSNSGIGADKSGEVRGLDNVHNDYWVVKIEDTGKKIWDKTLGGDNEEEQTVLVTTPEGNYLLGGSSISGANGDKSEPRRGSQGRDYWIVTLKEELPLMAQWDMRYGGSGNEGFTTIIKTSDGGYLSGGYSNSGISGDKSQSSQGKNDYWIVKSDKNGKKLWDKRYGGSDQDQLLALLITSKNTILLAGHSASGKSGEKSQDTQGKKDYWLLHVNSKGEKLWDKTYGGSEDELLRSLIEDKDGGYVLGGTSFSGKSGDKTQESQGSSDYWIVKTNSKGAKLWDKRYGGSGTEELRTVIQTQEGGFLLGGKSDSGVSGDRTQPSQGGSDYWVVKVAPEDNAILGVEETTLSASPIIKALSVLKSYPNPTQEKVTVSFTLPQTQIATIKLYDNQGREMATLFQGAAKANRTYQVEWQAGNIASGMYLIRLNALGKNYVNKLFLLR